MNSSLPKDIPSTVFFDDSGENVVYHASPISPKELQLGRDLLTVKTTAYFSHSLSHKPVSPVDGVGLFSKRPHALGNKSFITGLSKGEYSESLCTDFVLGLPE